MPAIPPIPRPDMDPSAANDLAITISGFGWDGALALALMCIAFIAITMYTEKRAVRLPLSLLISTVLVGAGMTAFYGLGWMLATVAMVSVTSFLSLMFSDDQSNSAPSPIPTATLNDEQIKRVLGMVQQGKCDERMRQKLLDLATSALPRLLERIGQHEAAKQRMQSLRDKLPQSEDDWSLAQKTVHERFQRLVGRLTRLTQLEAGCRQQLDALEAVMLDDALMGDSSGALEAEHNELMAAVNEALVDAQHEISAHDELDALEGDNVADLRRRRAAAKARTPDRH
jgi:molybdopterin converting factor small subunit